MAIVTTPAPTLFILDDDVGFVHAAAELARAHGWEITIAGTLEQARARLASAQFDLALLDLNLPDGDGLALIDAIDLGRTQVVLCTGRPTVDSALKALRVHVADYLVKPLHASQFTALLDTAARRRPATACAPGRDWHGIAGESKAIRELRRQVQRVAPTDAAVFVEGESGTGKELVAGAIHAESGRRGAFVAINCGAVPADLLATELFGHERGSFTGATGRHIGVFEQAQGGTLFLDEITEMPAKLQVHLLRALESRRIRRVGGSDDIAVDVRIVSATNRPFADAIREGRLREDLYYRLAEFPLAVPPLRERPDDILLIADVFLQRLNARHDVCRRLSQDGAERLLRHGWPGNVRELKNVLQRAFILAEDELVTPVPGAGATDAPLAETQGTITFAVGTPMHEIERRMLFKTLAYFDNNKARAAQALGITTKTIYNRLHAYRSAGIPVTEGEPAGARRGTDHDEA
ncbi:hypothetical protein P873_07965 [Arenimonas composti TR7-09 = DSM 18010]|uniref:Fis family transcriptional regulator n=1 Tax=Arenimonas composti TR7-09 = DSM 18010 TaxID=1121013 RepID=A0A091BH98_9GAMM|nr:hypothetical protein P873_07965 [Arenimonas composti TR7-09 = DSM 18010]